MSALSYHASMSMYFETKPLFSKHETIIVKGKHVGYFMHALAVAIYLAHMSYNHKSTWNRCYQRM